MFDRCLVINLDRRPDRMAAFLARLPVDWPFVQPERWRASEDNDNGKPPDYWKQCPGSWGCLQSHLRIYRWMCAEGLESVLVLEDDAIFAPGFSSESVRFLEHCPSDWDQIYFGGQHFRQDRGVPQAINGLVLRCFNVNRTHAYAIRRCFAQVAADYIEYQKHNRHVDYILGDLHERNIWNIYAPRRWLVGQAAGPSDICQRVKGREEVVRSESWWNVFYYRDELGRKAQAH